MTEYGPPPPAQSSEGCEEEQLRSPEPAWSSEEVRQILPGLPPRAEKILAARLLQLERIFFYAYPFWSAERPVPSRLSKKLAMVSSRAHGLLAALKEQDIQRHLLNDLSIELASLGGSSSQLIEHLTILANAAHAEAERWDNEKAANPDKKRHQESLETRLQHLCLQLFEHMCRLLPRSLGARMGRSYNPIHEREGGRMVQFVLAVFEAVRLRHPDKPLKPITAGAVASTYRDWQGRPGQHLREWPRRIGSRRGSAHTIREGRRMAQSKLKRS